MTDAREWMWVCMRVCVSVYVCVVNVHDICMWGSCMVCVPACASMLLVCVSCDMSEYICTWVHVAHMCQVCCMWYMCECVVYMCVLVFGVYVCVLCMCIFDVYMSMCEVYVFMCMFGVFGVCVLVCSICVYVYEFCGWYVCMWRVANKYIFIFEKKCLQLLSPPIHVSLCSKVIFLKHSWD